MANLTTKLLAAIGFVFILQIFMPGIASYLVFDPATALVQPWRFITSIFLHGGVTHLFFNAYALFMFGTLLERRLSSKDYLILFFTSGILGGLFYYATYMVGIIPPIPALGASGAIYGILGSVAMLMPEMSIFVLFFPMRMREAVIFWIFIEFVGSFDITSGVASAAHLGGLLFGLAYGWYLKNKPPEFHTKHYDWEVAT